jgi:aspartate ammonia-lyase
LKSRQYNTGRFPAPAVCTRAGLITALGPALGYGTSSRIAKRALAERRRVADLVLEEGLMTEAELKDALGLEAMTRLARILALRKPAKPTPDTSAAKS